MEIKKLISWSKKNFSQLPWREDRSVYSTWISEVMLQQTTVYTVKSRLNDFIKEFPSVKALALATEEQLLVAWKGLGYYQRAKNLRKAAQYIHNELDGTFPKEKEELEKIPGIGPYTSSALISIGMDKKSIAVDANLERVLARYYGLRTYKGQKLKDEIQALFVEQKILNENVNSWRDLNEALMDLGRVICQARKAECLLCPIRKNCQGYQSGRPLEIPLISPKIKKEKFELDLIRLVSMDNGKIAVVKKKKGEWLAGQYELPTFVLKSEDKKLKQYPFYDKHLDENLPYIKTGITKYKIKNFYQKIPYGEIAYAELVDIEIVRNKLSTASQKILKELNV